MSAHTPGPWRAMLLSGSLPEYTGWHVLHPNSKDANDYIVRLNARMLDTEKAERKANARLIAAAPELLEALKAVDRWRLIIDSAVRWSDPKHSDETTALLHQVRAAISRATPEGENDDE